MWGAITGRAATLAEYRADLIKWEGYRLTQYGRGAREPALVGIGHRLSRAELAVHPSHRYTPLEVESLFNRDLARALDACRRAFPSFDHQRTEVQLVLVGLTWCCGVNGITKWKDLQLAIKWRAPNLAQYALASSKWFGQVGSTRANAYRHTLYTQLTLTP